MNEKLKNLNALLKRLEKDFGNLTNHINVLFEYNEWWRTQNIKTIGKDGWPLPFIFDEENIKRFVTDWLGPE